MHRIIYKTLRDTILAQGGSYSVGGVSFRYNPDFPTDGIAIIVGTEQQGVIMPSGTTEYRSLRVERKILDQIERSKVQQTLQILYNWMVERPYDE